MRQTFRSKQKLWSVNLIVSALFSYSAFFLMRIFPRALFSTCAFFLCACFRCIFFQCAFFLEPKERKMIYTRTDSEKRTKQRKFWTVMDRSTINNDDKDKQIDSYLKNEWKPVARNSDGKTADETVTEIQKNIYEEKKK